MRSRLAVGCVLVLAAAASVSAEDAFEPNPSLARLSADDAYARRSARSLRTAGIYAARAIRLDDAGRVLVAGAASGGPFVPSSSLHIPRVARLDIDGRLDATFGAAGVAEVPVWGEGALGLEIDAAGRIVVAGFLYEPGTYPPESSPEYGAARLLADGSLDLAFSGDGLLERDGGTGVYLLGPFHASGGDGAMLAVAAKAGPDHTTQFGLVRIAADGTIDPTYGGGFARLVQGYADQDVDSVADFAVDSEGRAAVVVQGSYGDPTVQRLDAAGGPDTSFWGSSPWDDLVASQVALDGAGRMVCLKVGRIFRLLPDGAADPTFSGDGFAWRLEAAGFQGGLRNYFDLWAHIRADPDFDPVFDDETGLLAVATRADRWVLARPVRSYDAKGRSVVAIRVQMIDPADPGAVVLATCLSPDRRSGGFAGLVVAPDGTAAYALDNLFVARVDLTARKALPLPDLRVKWLGWPRAVDFGDGRCRVSARVRIRNAARNDADLVYGYLGLGDVEVAPRLGWEPDPDRRYIRPFRVRARSTVVRRLTWEGTYRPQLAGSRLSIQFSGELPDANFADNAATSRPITPVYAPR